MGKLKKLKLIYFYKMLKSIIFATCVLTVVSAGLYEAAPSYGASSDGAAKSSYGAASSYSAPASFYSVPAYEQKPHYNPQRNNSPARRNSAQTPVHKNRPKMLAHKELEQNDETKEFPVSLEQNELKKDMVKYKFLEEIGGILDDLLRKEEQPVSLEADDLKKEMVKYKNLFGIFDHLLRKEEQPVSLEQNELKKRVIQLTKENWSLKKAISNINNFKNEEELIHHQRV